MIVARTSLFALDLAIESTPAQAQTELVDEVFQARGRMAVERVLAIGGEKSSGEGVGKTMKLVADSVAGIPETALRRVGDARELVRLIAAGELNGLVSVSFDPPATRGLAGALDMLEFHLAMDTVLGRVARRADLVLPLTSARVRAQDRARSTAGIS